MVIRKIEASNVKQCAEIYRECFNEAPYRKSMTPESSLAQFMKKYNSEAMKDNSIYYEENGEMLGFLVVRCRNRVISLGPLGVKQSKRGKKVGLLLVEHAIKKLKRDGYKQIMLNVNVKAEKWLIPYYEKAGFKEFRRDDNKVYMRLIK